MNILADRKALVVGAGGIGLRVSERMKGLGIGVVAADVDGGRLAEAAERLGGAVSVVQMDVTDWSSVREGVDEAARRLGGLDTLMNAAGNVEVRRFEEVSVEEWDSVQAVNLRGTFLTIKAALPYLRASGRGSIVNIASAAGKRGVRNLTSYSAAKFGVVGLTQALAGEFGPLKIRVNAVCPANVPATPMGQKVLRQKAQMGWDGTTPEAIMEKVVQAYPLGRLGTTDDIAGAMLFLISEDAQWISGEALNVDGGTLAG